METTNQLKLPYIMPAQAQKHVTYNEALRMLDALVQLSVQDRDLGSPPEVRAEGDAYIVGPGASGDWTGQAGRIAAMQDGGWAFLEPREGWRAWVADERILCVFSNGGWQAALGPLQNLSAVGVNATSDSVNRLAVSSRATLFDNEDGDHQLKINKAAAGDFATVLFQSGYQGRAEIGLAGADDLVFKLSADGANWIETLRLTAEGRAVLPAPTPLTQLGQVVAFRDIRERLRADRTYYVRPGGNDGNSGIQNTASGAFATIRRAIEVVFGEIDLGPFNVTIQLGDGVYTESIAVLSPHVGAGVVTLAGNTSSPGSTVMAGASGIRTIVLTNGAALAIRDFELRGNAQGATQVTNGAILRVGSGMRFGAAIAAHLHAQDAGVISTAGANYTIVGGSGRHLLAVTGSVVNAINCTVTLVGSPAFTTAYAQANRASVVNANNSTFIGSASGKRFDAATNGVIFTGDSVSYLPGDAPGTTGTGGQYA